MGRGALTLGTSHLLLTEPVPIPKLVLSGRVPQQDNHTIRCGISTALRIPTHCSLVLSPRRLHKPRCLKCVLQMVQSVQHCEAVLRLSRDPYEKSRSTFRSEPYIYDTHRSF